MQRRAFLQLAAGLSVALGDTIVRPARLLAASATEVTAELAAMRLGGTVTYTIVLRNGGADAGAVFLAGSVPPGTAFQRQEITPFGAVPLGYVSDGTPQQSAAWLVESLPAGAMRGPFSYQVAASATTEADALGAHAFVAWDRPTRGTFLSAPVAPGPIGAPLGVPITPETPNGTTVRPQADADGVKRVTLTAAKVDQELLNYGGKRVVARTFGFNGGSPGPTLVFTEGDRVAITVVNTLPEATSVHWHGVILPNAMDGVPAVGEPTPRILPGEHYTYQFTVQQAGTHMFHSHTDGAKQDLLELAGALIFLPAQERSPHVDHDYVYFLNEWALPQGLQPSQIVTMPRTGSSVDTVNSVTAVPNWIPPTFNFFTMNGKSYPSTQPLDVNYGQRIRIRFMNIGISTHPMHLHGQDFLHTEQDGNAIAPANQLQLNTIPVAPGQTQAIEFSAVNPGIWPLHCHIAHHQTNNFSSGFGGMATVVRIAPA